MNNNILKYTLRVNRKLFKKFRHIAKYDNCSANKQLEQYIKYAVKEFEEKHGEIKLDD